MRYLGTRSVLAVAYSILVLAIPVGLAESSNRTDLTHEDRKKMHSLTRAARYQVTWQVRDGKWAYRAQNKAQGFSVAFAEDGLHLAGEGWNLELAPAAWGGQVLPSILDRSRLQGDRTRVDYGWGDSVLEEWNNTPAGLLQRLTLYAPSPGYQSSSVLALRFGGTLRVAVNGSTAQFSTRSGEPVLSYGPVFVCDAIGRALTIGLRVAEAGLLVVDIEDSAAVYPLTMTTKVSGIVSILRASDAQEYDMFGSSVAISGDVVVVGVAEEDGGPGDPITDAGAVYVFERNQGGADNWGEVNILRASDAVPNSYFGLSVDISGDTVVVGGGHGVYVFQRDWGGVDAWGEVLILHSSDAQIGDFFGYSAAISGDTVVVGAPNEDGGPGDPLNSAGAAYIFDRNEGGPDVWGEVAILHASDAREGGYFGGSSAIAGDTVVIGATYDDGNPADPAFQAGAAYIFERNRGGADAWGEAAILHASDAENYHRFGVSVAISSDTVVVGADQVIERLFVGIGPGAAYVFERNLGGIDAWDEAAILGASDAQTADMFGHSVAISGDTVVVGAFLEDGGSGDPIGGAGTAYVFSRNEGGAGAWGEVEIVRAPDAQVGDRFGLSVAIGGDMIVVGASHEAGGPGDPVTAAGATYIYQMREDEIFADGFESGGTASWSGAVQ